jgi:hypothetical protein
MENVAGKILYDWSDTEDKATILKLVAVDAQKDVLIVAATVICPGCKLRRMRGKKMNGDYWHQDYLGRWNYKCLANKILKLRDTVGT